MGWSGVEWGASYTAMLRVLWPKKKKNKKGGREGKGGKVCGLGGGG